MPELFDAITPDEKAAAQAFVDAVGEPESTDKKPAKEAPDSDPAENPEAKEAADDTPPADEPKEGADDTEPEPDSKKLELGKRAQRRIGQLTARNKALEARLQRLEASQAETAAKLEPKEELAEDATPEERLAYIERQDAIRAERQASDARDRELRDYHERAHRAHDGRNGKATMADQIDRWKDIIDQEPGYELVKNKILTAADPYEEFYYQASLLDDQEEAEERKARGEVEDEANAEKDSARVFSGKNPRRKGKSAPQGSPEDRAFIEKTFGGGGERLLPGEK